MQAIKQFFFLPAAVLITVTVIALVHPPAIFGGISYGGMLGIYIPIIVVAVCAILWVYLVLLEITIDNSDERKGNIIYFVLNLASYAVTLVMMIVCVATLSSRVIYIKDTDEFFRVANNIPDPAHSSFCFESDLDLGKRKLPFADFHGTLDGGGHRVLNLFETDGNGSVAPFVKYNYGTVKNWKFENYDLVRDVSDEIDMQTFGVVAGYNYGTVDNCSLVNCYINCGYRFVGFFTDDSERKIGCVVGYNYGGTIGRCEVYYDSMPTDVNTLYYSVKFNNNAGVAMGTIAGYSSDGNISNCLVWNAHIYCRSQLHSMADDPKSSVGGLVGLATRTNISSCIACVDCESTAEGNTSNRYGSFIGAWSKSTATDCYAVESDCLTIGNAKDGSEHVVTLPESRVDLRELPDSFSAWKESERGVPTPIVATGNRTSGETGLWILLGVYAAVLFGVAVFNYVRCFF